MLKRGKVAGIYNIRAVFRVKGRCPSPLTGKRGWLSHSEEGMGNDRTKNYCGITLVKVPGKMLAHLLVIRIQSHLLKFQRRVIWVYERYANNWPIFINSGPCGKSVDLSFDKRHSPPISNSRSIQFSASWDSVKDFEDSWDYKPLVEATRRLTNYLTNILNGTK